jgi:hypothetical protein
VSGVVPSRRTHSEEERRCPRCGGPVDSYPTCHTWPQSRPGRSPQWMACLPCDSATEWICDSDPDEDDCYWSYTEDLNPGNPKAAANELNRPSWLGERLACGTRREDEDQ